MTDQTVSADPASIRGMDLAAYLVRDPKAAIAFYRDVLGLEPTAVDNEGRGAEFTLADGSTFGVWRPEDQKDAGGGAVMFAVADVPAAIARIRERGAEVSEPMESPVCTMAFGKDPEGNGYIIHCRKNPD
jgi:predicted enzyme related to lactoylglutathione lyase